MKLVNPTISTTAQARVTLDSSGASGNLTLGGTRQTKVPEGYGYQSQAIIVGNTATFAIGLDNATAVTGAGNTTAWTAGSPQVETTTVVGTVTTAGNATVIVTAPGMAGSPLTLQVPVALNDSASAVATKVRAALTGNSVVNAFFASIGGAGAAVAATWKPRVSYTLKGVDVPIYSAGDAAANIRVTNGTCAGLTLADSVMSGGVATAGCYHVDADGTDLEGDVINGTGIFGFDLGLSTKEASLMASATVDAGGTATACAMTPTAANPVGMTVCGVASSNNLKVISGNSGSLLATLTVFPLS